MRNHCSFCCSGVRKLNCYKNIGKMKYAFDDDQCQVTLPKYTVMQQRLMGLLESSSWLVRAAIGSNWCPHHLRDSTKDRGCLRHRCCGSSRIAPVLMPLHGLEAHHPANCEYVVSRGCLITSSASSFRRLNLAISDAGMAMGRDRPISSGCMSGSCRPNTTAVSTYCTYSNKPTQYKQQLGYARVRVTYRLHHRQSLTAHPHFPRPT